jgi:hypothetical protein
MALCLRHQAQIYFGFFERQTYRWLGQFSRDIAVGIDVGAAFGEYTLFFLKNTSAVKVYSFEPDQLCRCILQQNLALMRQSRASDWRFAARP